MINDFYRRNLRGSALGCNTYVHYEVCKSTFVNVNYDHCVTNGEAVTDKGKYDPEPLSTSVSSQSSSSWPQRSLSLQPPTAWINSAISFKGISLKQEPHWSINLHVGWIYRLLINDTIDTFTSEIHVLFKWHRCLLKTDKSQKVEPILTYLSFFFLVRKSQRWNEQTAPLWVALLWFSSSNSGHLNLREDDFSWLIKAGH